MIRDKYRKVRWIKEVDLLSVNEVIDFLKNFDDKHEVDKGNQQEIKGFCALSDLKNNSLTWAYNADMVSLDDMNQIDGIVLMIEYGEKIVGNKFPIIYVENVRRAFFRTISHFFSDMEPDLRKEKIETSAIVESHSIGKNVYIGHNCYIGKNVSIGDNVKILHNVTIDGKVSIGDNTSIGSGTVIGSSGFGYYRDEDDKAIKMPHYGGVVIGKYVDIGANNTIDRGVLVDTIIEDYVKIDTLCHIAHNVHIKERTMLSSHNNISGSVEVGKNVWFAPGSVVKDGIRVGDNAFLGLGSAAIKDVPENKVSFGIPARAVGDR